MYDVFDVCARFSGDTCPVCVYNYGNQTTATSVSKTGSNPERFENKPAKVESCGYYFLYRPFVSWALASRWTCSLLELSGEKKTRPSFP